MAYIIKLVGNVPQVIEDDWQLLRSADEIQADRLARSIVPFSYWRDRGEGVGGKSSVKAVWISPDDDFEPYAKDLHALDLIAVDFPSFRDGRGYSIATLLRARYAWIGQLRAVGDVLRDQLNYMRRCGFDAFAVRADKDIHDALLSFSHYSVKYQGAVDDPLPLFRRRYAQDVPAGTFEPSS